MHFPHREPFQVIWLLLMDSEFMHAYIHGLLICCADGIWHLVSSVTQQIIQKSNLSCLSLTPLPMKYTKILIACIRYLAKCLCPWCLVQKTEIANLGQKHDMRSWVRQACKDSKQQQYNIDCAHRLIFEKGIGVESTAVNALLDSKSLTAIKVSIHVISFRY